MTLVVKEGVLIINKNNKKGYKMLRNINNI